MPTSIDLLAEEAFAWVARRARLVAQPTHVDPAEKFIVRSALQKAVRRGQTDRAVDLALRLHRIDRGYTWRAALTVAVEDVGIGSPQAVLWATAAQAALFRRRVGELPLLIALVREMSLALKSRAACELAFVVNTGEPEVFHLFGQMTTAQLLARVEDDDPYEAYAALAVLRGLVPKSYRIRPPDREGVLRAQEIIHDQLPFHHARAAAAALLRPLDEMSIAAFPAFRLGYDAGDAEIVGDRFPESCLIGGYPSEAYDQHERLGRRAIRRFAMNLRERHAALRQLPQPTVYAVVADAVFIEEGQRLNRWIASGDLRRLRQEADDFSLTRHGLAQQQGHAVREIVRSAIPELNDHREAAVRAADSSRTSP